MHYSHCHVLPSYVATNQVNSALCKAHTGLRLRLVIPGDVTSSVAKGGYSPSLPSLPSPHWHVDQNA